MRKRWLALLMALMCVTTTPALQAGDGREFHPIEWDLRSLPALGFFPMGGNLRLTSTQLSSYLLGLSIDTLNFTDPIVRHRMTLMNFSAYLAGINYTALLQNNDRSEVFSLAYLRVGPHYRWAEMVKERGILSFGSQLGMGMVIQGNTEEGQSRYLYGLDVSFTLTYTPFRELASRQRSSGYY